MKYPLNMGNSLRVTDILLDYYIFVGEFAFLGSLVPLRD